MTTNQTIDGVPRELIARAVTAAHIADCPSLRDELRALLDSPACKRCNGSGWIDNLRPVGTQAMDCPDCKTATQVRGEPVTMDGKTTIREYVSNSVPEDQIGDDWTKGYEECKRRIHQMFQQPVNAEQPAPVAVLPKRLQQVLKFLDGSGTLDGYSFGDVHTSRRKFWWRNELRACLDELKRLNPSL